MEPVKKTFTRKTGAPKKKAAPSSTQIGNQKKASAAKSAKPRISITPEERHRLIAQAAYLKAEGRGFHGGDPAHDWLEAEAEIDARLMKPGGEGI
jgi:hypothetical protein